MIAHHNQDFLAALDTLLSGWQAISQLADREATTLINVYKKYSMNVFSEQEMELCLLAFIERHAGEFNRMAELVCGKRSENFHHELKRNLLNKTRRMKVIEHKKRQLPAKDIIANMECALKSAFYMHLRYLYNHIQSYNIPAPLATALFFFVRENAYASMFRYNSQGEFNVPYGGLSYNRKDLARKISYMRSPAVYRLLSHTVIENIDFEEFLLKHSPQPNDFIFLDPPYHSEFSTYAKNTFTMNDQERLANYLINRCQAKFMLVIKNTSFIFDLYNHANLSMRAFDKKYLVSFQDRNDRNAEHLIITNY